MKSKKCREKIDVDGGSWIPLPMAVLNSSAFTNLPFSAKVMLIELVRQISLVNNGFLRASRNMLKPRGWNSQDTITRALKQLEAAELIFKTHQGGRPNRASLYAVTWTSLYPSPKFDPGAHRAFRRGAWRGNDSPAPIIISSPKTGSASTHGRFKHEERSVDLNSKSEQ
jgi:hypothetical protein